MLEPPQNVFGPVATDAEIQCVAWGVVLLPDFFPLIVEVLDDGIADVEQIHVSLPGPLIHDFMPQEPIGIGPPDRHDGRIDGEAHIGQRERRRNQAKEQPTRSPVRGLLFHWQKVSKGTD